jgi:hypothetical protein
VSDPKATFDDATPTGYSCPIADMEAGRQEHRSEPI